jgi:nicotinate-nucleotide pyrophosphorylase (carboxylating)
MSNMINVLVTTSVEADIKEWLNEDNPFWDISITSIPDQIKTAKIISKNSGMIVGIDIAKIAFRLLNCKLVESISDGDLVKSGDVILKVEGKLSELLLVERVILNILSHLSGIATKTNKLINLIKSNNLDVKIAATRKTLPGLRKYQKYAVSIAGGDTHRLSLSDMVMLKDNHLSAFSSITEALQVTQSKVSVYHKIEIEVTNRNDAIEAARTNIPDFIMLDNMSVEETKTLIPELKKISEKILFEASGNITSENIIDYASSGVDIISMGNITHSVEAFDLSMIIEK